MRHLLAAALAALVCFGALDAQTLINKDVVSDSKGTDYAPRIVPNGVGQYVVMWARDKGAEGWQIKGRRITLAGSAFVPGSIKSLVGTTLYRWSSYGGAALSFGSIVVGGTRDSNRNLVHRVHDSNLKPVGGIVKVAQAGFNATFSTSYRGALVSWLGDAAQIAEIDSKGKLVIGPVALPAFTKDCFIQPSNIVAMENRYLVTGLETRNDYSQTRACGIPVDLDLNPVGKEVAYESAFVTNSFIPGSAWDGKKGFVVFGHSINDASVKGSIRALKSTGAPSGATKKFPPGGSTRSAYYRIAALTGTDSFVATWYDFNRGNTFLQRLSSKGTAIGQPIPLAGTDYTIDDDAVDLAWDAATKTLLVVYSEYVAEPKAHSDIWLAAYRVD